MSTATHKTMGIVLRTVRYGETSMIVTIFTELFGIQSYLVNGVRVSTRKGMGKAGLFQPAAILDLVVYHNEMKQLQRIKEYQWGYLYHHIFSDVRKNAVALFMIELLTKCLKQPEANSDLYHFTEDVLMHLDLCGETATANFPLFFALHLSYFFGFRISDRQRAGLAYLDLREGRYTAEKPGHPHFLEGEQAVLTGEILDVMKPEELEGIRLNHLTRRSLLAAYESYYSFHIQDFGKLKTFPVLQTVLG